MLLKRKNEHVRVRCWQYAEEKGNPMSCKQTPRLVIEENNFVRCTFLCWFQCLIEPLFRIQIFFLLVEIFWICRFLQTCTDGFVQVTSFDKTKMKNLIWIQFELNCILSPGCKCSGQKMRRSCGPWWRRRDGPATNREAKVSGVVIIHVIFQCFIVKEPNNAGVWASFWSVMRSRRCMFAASARAWKLEELKNVKIYHSPLFGGPTAAKKVRSAATLLLFCFWNPDPAVFLSVDPDPDLAFLNFLFLFYNLYTGSFLLDPDPGGKMNADPDPQPCFLFIIYLFILLFEIFWWFYLFREVPVP